MTDDTDNAARQADRWLRGVEREWREWYAAHRLGDHKDSEEKDVDDGLS